MRTPVIAGNWKMNLTHDEAVTLVRAVQVELDTHADACARVEQIVCPPFTSLAQVAEAVQGSRMKVGAQNIYHELKGAYTGEVSATMIKPFCTHVILGHSERRQYARETDEDINKKVHTALTAGLIPVVCVGENLEQNESGQTEQVVSAQVGGSLAGLAAADTQRVIIAYEPVWAIGTGRAATPQAANETIGIIRRVYGEMYGADAAGAVRILYGGSVTPANIAEIIAQPEIDGALVGGASLKAADFSTIIRLTAESEPYAAHTDA